MRLAQKEQRMSHTCLSVSLRLVSMGSRKHVTYHITKNESCMLICLIIIKGREIVLNYVCDVTLSIYPHRESLKNMPGHGGNQTYDLWNTSPIGLIYFFIFFFYLAFAN
jgi:hypothetical protein